MTATIAGVTAGLHTVASPPADKVTPGFLGFIVIFALALVVLLLIRSMVGHMRKVRYGPNPADESEPGTPEGPAEGKPSHG